MDSAELAGSTVCCCLRGLCLDEARQLLFRLLPKLREAVERLDYRGALDSILRDAD